ncbi:putative RNA recognition motif domain, nucleotide-binding alpha-beta plait domain superfamily [Helianthus annuus]|nr:putative RNA recognition motif domain, nucleotide-binding alpha-beta plait domain superfamily [Helianthus annuus]KAJ0661109.1 putative RNA recognition motif domain, nucleotide-binding alpha-beta plait domain superfamily [Helianthus annuus]KAJ0841685.1 putative RNA recognition motif domain, nucleotide-binding alpha-beta plait domain superfamily [Helianthus annuus]KAJ0855213.1 putative RNA recognition motif domain, nucleotide-binding alpha-beta plait domain superfamily [Helianthus annuus]
MRKTSLIHCFARQVIRASSSSSSYCRSFSSSPSNNKLFVAGLSWSVDEKSLKEAFSSFGEVSEVRIMYDKDSGRSRGFGFVNFSREDEASSAKDAMDGKALLGRPLKVSFALDKVNREPLNTRYSNRGTTFGRSR